MLPSTIVSANYHSLSSYFRVQEWIGMEIYLQPIDRGWTIANKRFTPLNMELFMQIDLWYTKRTLLNGDIYWFPNGNVRLCYLKAIHPPPQTLIYTDVPANTECWGVGCDITVKRQKTDPGYDSDVEQNYKFKMSVMTYMYIDIQLY